MDIRDIYKKYVALEEQATMTVSADSAEEIASLLGIMKNAGLEQSGVVTSHDDEDEGCGCSACSAAAGDEEDSMSDLSDIAFLAGANRSRSAPEKGIEEWDNEPDEEYKDDDFMMNTLSGGINRPKKMYAKAQDGDNAMAVESVKARLIKALEEAKKSKPDFLDVDKDGNKKEPMKKALKDKKKKKK